MNNSILSGIRNASWLLLVGLAVVMTGVSKVSSAAEPRMCAVADKALAEAARIRGLKPNTPVPCVTRSRAEIEAFLKGMIAEKFPKDTLEMEQIVYRAIGLVPDDYDYVHGIVQAYVQQIGGYYDPDKRLFVMLDTMPEKLQFSVAVHELTHALQDQRFNLNRFLDPSIKNNDELMARAALVEGDASAVMQDYMRSRSSERSRKDGDIAAPEPSAPVPDALEQVLLFPYIQGLSFARRVAREGGYAAINDAFNRPPKTTREVLHPEQYITRAFVPSEFKDDALEAPKERSRPIFTDTVGEFVVSAMLGAALSSQTRGEECSTGWKRDRVGVFEGDKGTRAISWVSEWDSSGEAQEFYECYREMLKVAYQRDVHETLAPVSPTKKMKVALKERVVVVGVEVGE